MPLDSIAVILNYSVVNDSRHCRFLVVDKRKDLGLLFAQGF